MSDEKQYGDQIEFTKKVERMQDLIHAEMTPTMCVVVAKADEVFGLSCNMDPLATAPDFLFASRIHLNKMALVLSQVILMADEAARVHGTTRESIFGDVWECACIAIAHARDNMTAGGIVTKTTKVKGAGDGEENNQEGS